MSIHINGINLPKRREEVYLLAVDSDGRVYHFPDPTCIHWRSEELPDCKALEVPPHGRLGDLDRLERTFADIDNAPYSGFDGEEPFYSADDAARIIRLAPTIIPAEKEN